MHLPRLNRAPNAAQVSVLLGLALLSPLGCAGSHEAYIAANLEQEMKDAIAADSAPELDALTQGSSSVTSEQIDRKIVYNCQLDLTVNKFTEFEKQIESLLQKHRGFASQRNMDQRHSNHGGGVWVLRVPVEHYNDFLTGVTSLGFATSRTETAEDVTENYVDLEARVSNKRKLEERIVGMLDERTGKLSDLMELERELSRVREEIERMEGRLRVLTDRTRLATITINISEQTPYEAPMAPTLGDQLSGSWTHSISTIAHMGTNLLIVLVAVIPWLILLLPILLILFVQRERIRGAMHQLVQRSMTGGGGN